MYILQCKNQQSVVEFEFFNPADTSSAHRRH